MTALTTSWCVDGHHIDCDGSVRVATIGTPMANALLEPCACDCHVYCPSSDHDGALVRVERQISAEHTSDPMAARIVDDKRCAYCAEGRVARLLRDGYRVTIEPLA